MERLKPWHFVLFGAAFLGLAFTTYRVIFGESVPLTSKIVLVDVVTGDLFEAKVGGRVAAVLPEKNPDTGQFTLLPASKDDAGVWTVSQRYLGSLSPSIKPTAVVSTKSGEIKVSSASPKSLVLGK
jgi:hypothetical protein